MVPYAEARKSEARESSESDEESSEIKSIISPPLGGPLSVGAGDPSDASTIPDAGDAASASLVGVAAETVNL